MSSMCLKPQCIFYLRWTWADRSLAWFPPRTCWDCCIGWWPGPTAELRGDTSNELLSKAECYQLLVLIVDIMCYIKWRWSSGDMWRVCRCTVHMSHLMSHIWYQPLCHYVSILNDCMMTILVNVKFSLFQSFLFLALFMQCNAMVKPPASKTSCFLLYLSFLLWNTMLERPKTISSSSSVGGRSWEWQSEGLDTCLGPAVGWCPV